MVCKTVDLPGGGRAIVCSRGSRPIKCHVCGKRGTLLCDGPMPDGETCDKPMCKDHAHHLGGDRDYCQKCFDEIPF